MSPEIEIWNDIALIRDDKYFTKWVKESGKLDHHDGFLHYLRPYLGGTIIDIGSNIGTHAIYYAQFGHVHCFEPNPIAFECLKYNMRKVDATLYNMAVGECNGYVNMSSPEDGNYGAVYTEKGDMIPVVTIDELCLDECDFIKIDNEGDEIEALRGAKDTIRKFKPVMCIESNPTTLARKNLTPNDLLITLHAMGYITKQRVPADISCDLLCEPASRK